MDENKPKNSELSLGKDVLDGCAMYVLKQPQTAAAEEFKAARIYWDMRPVFPGRAVYLSSAREQGLGQSPSLKGLWRERLN